MLLISGINKFSIFDRCLNLHLNPTNSIFGIQFQNRMTHIKSFSLTFMVLCLFLAMASSTSLYRPYPQPQPQVLCNKGQILTPSGCWDACDSDKFKNCPDFFIQIYNPSYCAYTLQGEYKSYTFACQACQNKGVIAVTDGACTCSVVKCPKGQYCQNGECVGEIIPEPEIDLCARIRCIQGYICKNGQCLPNTPVEQQENYPSCKKIQCSRRPTQQTCPTLYYFARPEEKFCGVNRYGEKIGFPVQCDACKDTSIQYYFPQSCETLVRNCEGRPYPQPLPEPSPQPHPNYECYSKKDCKFSFDCKEGRCVNSCQLIDCQKGFYCVEGQCRRSNFNTNPIDPCLYTKCSAGYHCEKGNCEKDIQIYPLPPTITCANILCSQGTRCVNNKCIPIKEESQPTITCATILCVEGTRCINNKCVPIKEDEPSITCANIRCAQGTRCVNGRCIPARPQYPVYPYDPLPPVTCQTIKCAKGYRCVNAQCILIDDQVITPYPIPPVQDSCATILCAPGCYCLEGKCINHRDDGLITIQPYPLPEPYPLPHLYPQPQPFPGDSASCAAVLCVTNTKCVNGKCIPINANSNNFNNRY